jgi:hypothetical protein
MELKDGIKMIKLVPYLLILNIFAGETKMHVCSLALRAAFAKLYLKSHQFDYKECPHFGIGFFALENWNRVP